MVMELLDDIIATQTEIAKVLTRVNVMDVPHELDDIADNAHRHLDLAYRLLESLYYEVEANE
tara:strand:- start:572 stop:757 length:186 start_codon:yes stop_codon:yes gene_type:complete